MPVRDPDFAAVAATRCNQIEKVRAEGGSVRRASTKAPPPPPPPPPLSVRCTSKNRRPKISPGRGRRGVFFQLRLVSLDEHVPLGVGHVDGACPLARIVADGHLLERALPRLI